ncbi:MAG: hypothetical protein ACI9XO_000976 [Paraglaciecola sp.]|jgi:hypothetical protein
MQFVEPLIGGVAAFILGALWYTKLFGKAWQAETGLSEEDTQKDMLRTHGLAFLMMVVMSFVVNFVINMHEPADQTFVHGGFHGMMLASMVAVPAMAINYLYQRKSLKLFLIDTSYMILLLGLSGGVMAAVKLG